MLSAEDNANGDFSAGRESVEDLGRLLDRAAWGEPASYRDLLTQPCVQSRVATCIVRAAVRNPYRRRVRRRGLD